MCTDSHQSDHRCADYKVRFYCQGMRQMCHSKNKTDKITSTDIMSTNQVIDEHVKRGKLSSKRDKKQENEILKNVTKPGGKRRHKFEDETEANNIDYGAVFHKHLLWNDRQKERRKSNQMVYVQWKKGDPHRLSKWRHWQ